MGARLPDNIPPWAAEIVVGHIPECDVAGLRRCADAWAAAESLTELADELEAAVEKRLRATAMEGDTAAAVAQQVKAIAADMRAVGKGCAALSRSSHQAATTLELQQYLAVGIAIAVTAQVTASLALFATGGSVMIAAQRIAARETVVLGWRNMMAVLAQQLARSIVRFPRSAMVVGATALGMGTGGAVNWGAQRKQIADGHRTGVDWGQVGVAVAAGGAGGAVGAPVGRATALAIIRQISAQAPRHTRIGAQVAATVAAGATGGLAGAAAGTVVAALAGGQDLRRQDLLNALIPGLGSGVVTALGSSLHAIRATAAGTAVSDSVAGRHTRFDFPPSPPAERPFADGSTPHSVDPTADHMSKGLSTQRRSEGERIAERLAGRIDLDPDSYRGPAREFAAYLRERYGDTSGSHGTAGSVAHEAGTRLYGSASDTSAMPGKAGAVFPSHSPETAAPASGHPDRSAAVAPESGHPTQTTTVTAAPDTPRAQSSTASDPARTESTADGTPIAPTTAPDGPTVPEFSRTPEQTNPQFDDNGSTPGGFTDTQLGSITPFDSGDPSPATRYGAAAHDTTDWFRPGQMNCVPEAVADTAAATGTRVDTGALPTDAGTRGVMMDDYLIALRADARPGGWPSFQALFDDVAQNRSHVAAAAQFAYGAHAFTVKSTQPGHFVIHEKSPILARNPGDPAVAVIRDTYSDGRVVEQNVDAVGSEVGALRQYDVPDAIDRWTEKFGRVTIIAGAEYFRVPGTEDRWSAALPLGENELPGGPDGLRHGLDVPSTHIGSDAAVLDRLAPAEVGLSPDVVALRFAEIARGLDASDSASPSPRRGDTDSADAPASTPLTDAAATGNATRVHSTPSPDSGPATPVSAVAESDLGTAANDRSTPALAAFAPGHEVTGDIAAPTRVRPIEPSGPVADGVAYPLVERSASSGAVEPESVTPRDTARDTEADPNGGARQSGRSSPWMTADSAAEESSPPTTPTATRPLTAAAEPEELRPQVPGPLIPTPQPALIPDPTRHSITYPMEHATEFEQPAPPAFPNPSFPDSDDREETANREPVIPREISESGRDIRADRPRFQPHDPSAEAETEERSPATEAPATPWTAPPQRFPATPPSHLPSAPPAGPAEAEVTRRHFPVRPDENTPGAPTDPARRPGLNPHSLSYNSPESDIPQHATRPGALPAPPPGDPVTPARPVPSMQASLGPSEPARPRGRRKPQRQELEPALHDSTPPIVRQPGPEDVARPAQSRAPGPGWESPTLPDAPGSESVLEWRAKLARRADAEAVLAGLEKIWNYLRFDESTKFDPQTGYRAILVPSNPDSGTVAVLVNWLAEHPEHHDTPIIFSGWRPPGAKSPLPEALLFLQQAQQLGLWHDPAISDRVILDPDATNSKQNAEFFQMALSARFGVDARVPVVLVCSPQHSRRIMATVTMHAPVVGDLATVSLDVPFTTYLTDGLRPDPADPTPIDDIVVPVLRELRGIVERSRNGEIAAQHVPAAVLAEFHRAAAVFPQVFEREIKPLVEAALGKGTQAAEAITAIYESAQARVAELAAPGRAADFADLHTGTTHWASEFGAWAADRFAPWARPLATATGLEWAFALSTLTEADRGAVGRLFLDQQYAHMSPADEVIAAAEPGIRQLARHIAIHVDKPELVRRVAAIVGDPAVADRIVETAVERAGEGATEPVADIARELAIEHGRFARFRQALKAAMVQDFRLSSPLIDQATPGEWTEALAGLSQRQRAYLDARYREGMEPFDIRVQFDLGDEDLDALAGLHLSLTNAVASRSEPEDAPTAESAAIQVSIAGLGPEVEYAPLGVDGKRMPEAVARALVDAADTAPVMMKGNSAVLRVLQDQAGRLWVARHVHDTVLDPLDSKPLSARDVYEELAPLKTGAPDLYATVSNGTDEWEIFDFKHGVPVTEQREAAVAALDDLHRALRPTAIGFRDAGALLREMVAEKRRVLAALRTELGPFFDAMEVPENPFELVLELSWTLGPVLAQRIHGDAHFGNTRIDAEGRIVFLDWEMARDGDPRYDKNRMAFLEGLESDGDYVYAYRLFLSIQRLVDDIVRLGRAAAAGLLTSEQIRFAGAQLEWALFSAGPAWRGQERTGIRSIVERLGVFDPPPAEWNGPAVPPVPTSPRQPAPAEAAESSRAGDDVADLIPRTVQATPRDGAATPPAVAFPTGHEIGFADLEEWADRLSDRDLDHALTSLHSSALDLLGRFHTGEQVSAASLFSVARALNAAVAERSYRLSDDAPNLATIDNADLAILGRKLADDAVAAGQLYRAAATIVQMTATTASGDIGRGRDFAGRFARMAYRVGYAADHVSRYEREQRSPDAAPARLELAPLRAANNAINPEPRHDHAAAYVEHGDPVPSSYHTAEYAAEADRLLRSGLAEGFGSALLTATGALPGQLDEYRHRTSASDTAYARAAADLLRTLYPLVQHHLRAGDTVRGLDHLEQIERVLSESRAHFPAVTALLDAETTVAEARTRLTDLAEFGPPLEHLERMAAEAARAFADNAPAAQAITAASGILREPSALSPHPPSHENAASASTRHIDMLTREINGILGADRVNGAGRDTPDLVAQVFELAGAHDRATLLSTATRLATEHRSFRHFRQALLVSLTNHAGAAPAASEVQALETSSREQLETALATLSGIERDYLTVRFAQGRSRPKTMALLRAEHGTGPLGRPRTLERAAVRRLAARLAQSVGEGGRAADDMRLPPAPAVRGQEPPAEYRPLGGPPGARGMPTDVATLLLQQGLSRLAPGERRDVVVGGGQFVLHFPDQSADISESEVYRHDTARGVQTRHAYEVFENVTLPDGSQAGRVLLLENVEGATPLAELADKPILAAAKLLQDTHFRTRFGERDRPAFISRLIAEENAKIAAQAAESADALAELGVPAEPFAPIQRWAEALATSGRWWSRRVSFALLHFGDYNDLLQLPDGRLVIGNPAHARPGDELLDFVRLYYHAPLGREAELLKAMVSVDPDAFDQYLKFVRTELILRGVRELSVAAAFGMLTSAQIAFARTELMPALRTSRLDWGQSPELRAEHLFKALGVWTPPGARQTERPHAETASATAPVSGDTAQPAEPALPDLATATTRDLLTWAESLSFPRARQLLTESLSDTVAATTAYHGARQQARELADSARVLNAVIAGLFRKLTDSGHPIVESRFTTDLLDDGALAALVSALAPWAPVAHDMHDGVRAVLDAIRALGHQSALPGALSEMATPYEEVAAALSKVTLAACRSQRIHSGRITYPSAIDRGFLTEKIERAMTVTVHALQEPSLAKVADRFLVSRNRSHPAAGPGTSPGPEVSFHDAFDLPYRSGTPWSRSGRNARRTALQEAIWYAYDERLSPDARAGENPRSQAAAVDVPPSSGTVPATSVDKPATLPPTPDTTPAPLAATYENASVPDALEHPGAIAGHIADEPAGPPRPTGVIPELGADVDALVTQSPTLTTHITELRAAGWTFDYGPTGEGSYADRDLQRIVIDSRHRDNPHQTTWTLSEEASIATSPHPALETGPQGRPAEKWIEAVAVERQRAEAEAQLFAYRIDDEIHHGHPATTPFTAAGPYHYTIDKNIYNQLTAGYITRDDALNELANANYHHARRRETTHTFTTYWHTRFTRHHPPAIPTSTHYRRINEEMILAHQAITGASTFDYYFAPHDPTSVAARSPLPGGELFPRDPAELAIVYAYHRGRSAQAHDPSPTRPQESNPSTPTTTPPPATDHAPPSPGGSHPDTTGPGQDRTSFDPGPTNPLAPQPHRVIGKHPAHERLQQGLAYHHDQNKNDPRFWDRPKPHTDTPSRAEAEGDETPDPAEISTTAEPSAPAPTESVTDGAEQAVPAPHLEPSDDAPAAPGEDSSTLSSIRQEFGPDVADLVAKSPTLLTRLVELRSAEWAFAYGPAGKGSYADRDNRTLNIDSRHQETGDLEQTVWDLAEQASIAASPSPALDTGPGHRPVQEWHEAVAAEYLRADTEGKLFAFGVQEEIEHAQGSPWNLTERFTHGDHRHRLNKAIYDRFTQGRIDLDDALNEIAANYSDHPQQSTGTFHDYWETRYTSRFSEAAPTEEQFRKIMQTLTVDQSLSNEDFPYFMDNDPRDHANDTKLFPHPPGARPLAQQDVVYAFDPDLPDDAHAKKHKKPAPAPSSASPDGNIHSREEPAASRDAEAAREKDPAPAAEPAETKQVPAEPDMVSTGELFKSNKDYRSIYVSNVLTEFGNSLQLSAVPLLTVQLTGSYETAGLITAATFVPKVFFEIPAGYLADLTDRWKLMIGSQAVGAAGVAVAGTAVALDVPNLGVVLAVTTFVDGVATVIYLRALGGTVKDLVTDTAQRLRANRLSAVQGYVGGIGGRALGPVLLSLDKLAPFVVNGASFVWNAGALYRMRGRLPTYPRREHRVRDIGRELGAAGNALWQDPFLRRYTGTITLTNLATAALNLRAVAVVEEAALPGWIAGPVLAAGAAGAVAAGILPRSLEKVDINAFFATTIGAFAAAAGVQAASSNPFMVGAGAFGFTMAAVAMNSRLTGHQMKLEPDGLFNRVVSIDKAVTGAGSAAGAWIAGGLLSANGIEMAGWMPAAVVGAAAACTGVHYVINRWREIRRSGRGRLYSPPTPTPTISQTLIGGATGSTPPGTGAAGSSPIRTFRVVDNSASFPGMRARIRGILADSALPTGSALTTPADRTASGITETSLDRVSQWKYPQRSDP